MQGTLALTGGCPEISERSRATRISKSAGKDEELNLDEAEESKVTQNPSRMVSKVD